jgi:L-fucose isomerase-like protein
MSETDRLVGLICGVLSSNPTSDWDAALCEIIAHCTAMTPGTIANIVQDIRDEHDAHVMTALADMPVEGSA